MLLTSAATRNPKRTRKDFALPRRRCQTVSRMSQPPEILVTTGDFPRISQKLKLVCQKCGERAIYDVGQIFYDFEGTGESLKTRYTFANYFRCRQCGGPGPWDIADQWKLTRMLLGASVGLKSKGFQICRCVMFDGSRFQAPAMGEEHLLGLIQKEPDNAFLHTRLGNLFKNCGCHDRAGRWFEQALRLNANDIEARHSLFERAVELNDWSAAMPHALELTRSLLAGHTTKSEELTEGLAASLVKELRAAPLPIRERFSGTPAVKSNSKAEIFIRTLLARAGDEAEIVSDAIERLRAGEPEPAGWNDAPEPPAEGAELALDLVPSLGILVKRFGLNPDKLTVALEADGQGNIRVCDKHSIPVTDGTKMTAWKVPALTELFRGDKLAPKDMDHYPPEYLAHFFFIENHVLTLCRGGKDQTDQEMEEIYAALRRRPDGRSLGAAHDFLWQVAALLLGSHVVGAAEYEALFATLNHSTRKWALRPVSRNYLGYLRKTFPSE